MMGDVTRYRWVAALAAGSVAAGLGVLVAATDLGAEYGDIIMNREAEKAEMPPVVFPHWFHRIRFKCKVCHEDIFVMEAGAFAAADAGAQPAPTMPTPPVTAKSPAAPARDADQERLRRIQEKLKT